jgi:hypothetical protein
MQSPIAHTFLNDMVGDRMEQTMINPGTTATGAIVGTVVSADTERATFRLEPR